MASVREVLDGLASGQLTLSDAVTDFRRRSWPPLPRVTDAQAYGAEDDTPAHPDSWDTVNSDSRLTGHQYQALAAAYAAATKGG